MTAGDIGVMVLGWCVVSVLLGLIWGSVVRAGRSDGGDIRMSRDWQEREWRSLRERHR